ncbi:XrtA-associated tyrosine autokinase [Niveibacterium sp. 24ML]|uniref:XrtA-associated tyrosine autokinase n=1 Tax=Niveibacterium sp. 24ML TaxID=2985512 RepID=UPI002272023F|nr:XrtA-associated tyrosine autokinase [Niveibacterium sp. 24ML]MCX9156884.1 XrtA-associated tyrosine autokinase [Niveibacterium sp. 24ML]
MSIIEKAVERLDQLKRAGVDVPEVPASVEPANAQVAASASVAPPAERAAQPGASARERRTVEIDLDRLAALGFVSPTQPNTPTAEQYRIIKRPVLRNAQGRGAAPVENGNLIMVTSSMPGEGKSFSAINLAISMAMELDHTVLLVDADVSKPSVLKALGLPPATGMLDVLTGQEASVADVMLHTNIAKLSILPAGRPQPRATEMLASGAMNRLLDELATRYKDRIIIFDSPPLLVTTEARALAAHMGQVVVVVEAERTTHSMVRQTLATLESSPVKLMLLNKVRQNSSAGHYGVYGYGYGYGYGKNQAEE